MSQRPLRDSASRHNIIASHRRQSFGGQVKESETTPQKSQKSLLDSSVFREGSLSSSSTRAISAPRRQSLGGDALRGETPIRDRRAMLEAWRQARAGNSTNEEVETKKRIRNDPPLPPSNAFTPIHRKLQRINNYSQESETPSQSSIVQSHDEEFENQSRTGSLLSSRTPRERRGKLGSARRHSLVGRNVGQYNGKLAIVNWFQ